MNEVGKKLIPPVIKWSGSKRPVAYQLSQYFPETKRFFDPFVGGGSILPFFFGKKAFVGDVIPELIFLWESIKTDPDKVINEYRTRWESLKNNGYTEYYSIRDTFNVTRNPMDFLFLSRTCVNGLIRYNKIGEFNNSLHHTRSGIDPERFAPIIKMWSKWIQQVSFLNQDYRLTLKEVTKGDTVFLDPPYVGTKSRYIPQKFDYAIFFDELERLNSTGVNWILTLDGNAGDRYYDSKIPKELYKASIKVNTGKSPFSKVMNNKQDSISESVYFNFQPIAKMPNAVL